MSTKEITYWGFVVPIYNNDKTCYRITYFDWNNEVFVVSKKQHERIHIRHSESVVKFVLRN